MGCEICGQGETGFCDYCYPHHEEPSVLYEKIQALQIDPELKEVLEDLFYLIKNK